MPLQLIGQNIETPIGDSGVYTWANVIALGSTFLTTHTATSGETVYRWTGRITIRGTAVLNITDLTLELLGVNTTNPGCITCEASGVVNFGEKNTISGITIYENGCTIIITRAFADNLPSGSFLLYAPLTYSPDSRDLTTTKINIFGSTIRFKATAASNRIMIFASAVEGCNMSCSASTYSALADTIILFMQSNALIIDSVFNCISVEFKGLATVRNSQIIRAQRSFLNWTSQKITLRNVSAISPREDNYLNQDRDSVFDFIDSAVDISLGRFWFNTGSSQNRTLFSIFLKIVNSANANVESALVGYAGRTNAEITTIANGLASFELVTRETTGSGITNPTSTADYSAYTFSVRSYLHLPVSRPETINSAVGLSALPSTLGLLTDLGVTQTNTTTVGAYTGVSHTASTTTISGTRTLAEIYDSRKLHWRNNSGLLPFLVGIVANFGGINIVVSGVLTNPGVKFLDGLQTAGSLTLAAPSSINFPVDIAGAITLQTLGTYAFATTVQATGIVNVVAGLTNLSSFTFTAGATINNSSASAATVSVASTVGIVTTSTGGGSITLAAPVISINAVNFANGVRVQASYRQIFTIASTAIAVATDIITLGNDANGNASAFRTTTPNTLIRFSLAVGATLPVSTPQVQDGGLYYFKSGGQLSVTENGTAINFTTQGTGNFTLIAETELNNSTVSGGLGYSTALVLTTGALVRIKAVHFTETAGVATTSKFFDAVFSWSSVSGITIIDVVNNAIALSKEPIHEQIVATSSLTLEAAIDNNVGAPITSITLPDSGSAVAGLALALEGVGKIQINANDTDGLISWQEIYLWGCFIRSTTAGIRLASAATVEANNFYNYQFLGIEFDNTSVIPLYIVGAVGRSSDGKGFISPATTGSIIPNALSRGTGAIVSVSGGGTAPTAIQIRQELDTSSTRLAAIDAKTAALNFTGANVQAIIATLPTIPANWITAAGINAAALTSAKFAPDAIDSNAIAASAISEIQSGLATTSAVGAIPTTPLLTGDTRLNSLANLDATVSSRLATTSYSAPLTAAQLWGATTASLTTVGTIGKLLSDNVNATINSRATPGDVAVSGGFTAGDRTALQAIPINPLLTGDVRLNNLDATISSRSIYNGTDTAGTTTLLSRITGSVMLTSAYTAPNNTGINDIVAKITKLYKRQGLTPGITATVTDAKSGIPGSLITSDGDINQTLTQVSDGVVRIST